MVDIPPHFKQFCHFCFAYLGYVGVITATVTGGQNHFEGCLVWVQNFWGSTAHPGGLADLDLVKSNSIPLSLPKKGK